MTLQDTVHVTKNLRKLSVEPPRPLAQDVLPKYEELATNSVKALEELQSHIKELHLKGDISYTPKDYVNSIMFDADKLVTDVIDLVVRLREADNGYSDYQEELRGEETTN